jgi:regulatory protein RepA
MNQLDLTNCFEIEPPPLDFVFCGLAAGTVGNISSPGATGKSFAGLEIGMGVASNEADCKLLHLANNNEGKVAIFNAEDPSEVVFQRLYSVGNYLSADAREQVKKNLRINCLMGSQPNISDTAFLNKIIKECEGKRLVIFDTFTRFHQLNENDNGQMSQVVSFYEKIATETGAGVLFLHHNSKGAVLNGQQAEQQATRGASSITDNCRWQGFLQKMSEAEAISFGITEVERDLYVKFGGNKENYGTKTVARWLRKHAGGVLLNSDLPMAGKANLKLVNNGKNKGEFA